MPDITMCTGTGCSYKETCVRATATPNTHRQSYFGDPPFKLIGNVQTCEYLLSDGPKRPQVSVRGTTYDKLKARADEEGKSVAQLLDKVLKVP